eukprot:TRINITY_DN77675_c0_g1_i1.p1 TRINITY_DN77675_c0_g1~~TRINITY_DN77675_c0_g1_i1.p1  ORF type:complete len:135 (+),score=0.69 TRINITY_DN77675_c0_g1_i1:73-477(+)
MRPKSGRRRKHVSTTSDRSDDGSVKLSMWDFGQCDIKRCSGRKLSRQGMLKILPTYSKTRAVVLSPLATRCISKADRDLVARCGLCVVDASWNKLESISFDLLHNGNERILPYLHAANPTHYGRPFEVMFSRFR